jgi:hypothetical protein
MEEKKMKKIAFMIVFSMLVALLPVKTVYAGGSDSHSNALGRIFTESLAGGAVGALVGAATLAFVDKASDHTENIGKGAAIGVILGAVYGTMKVSGPLAELNNGKIKLAFPAIKPVPSAFASKDTFVWNIEMFRASF